MRRSSRRGVTLIELMISVAILSIGVSITGNEIVSLQKAAAVSLEREKALQFLELEATARLNGGSANVERARLLAELPDAVFVPKRSSPVTTLTVTWRLPDGRRGSRSIAIVEAR